MLPIEIRDGHNKGYRAKVTEFGQLVVAPLAYDETVFNELAEPDTAYNFYKAKANKRFVITGIIAHADKQVGTIEGATFIVYEAETDDTTTVSKVLFQTQIAQQQTTTVLPLNIIVTEGQFVNAKTDDDDVHTTIMGYYIDIP